ncbi:transcriptional regulator, TetR family [Streptomyces sp. WMMB 714]|nr:transcriptional regulator, TetR family [Streptomyces sp. WMMB 714]
MRQSEGWGGLLEPSGSPPPESVTACNVPHMSDSAKPSRSHTASSQRLRMRRELAAAAMELFATKGYEATTVDEIAATAGVARRTFFRHFRAKEEAIFPDHDDTLVRAQAVLEAAPAHENPLDTVCRGIKEVMRMYAASPKGSVERYKLTREVPALREREIASVARYERLFTRYLLGHFDEAAHRDGVSDFDEPLLAEVAASAVVTAHNHVLRRWLRNGGVGDVEAQLDHAFAIVRKTFGTGFGANRLSAPETSGPGGLGSRSAAGAETVRQDEVLVTVARTDAPLGEIMDTIERALRT